MSSETAVDQAIQLHGEIVDFVMGKVHEGYKLGHVLGAISATLVSMAIGNGVTLERCHEYIDAWAEMKGFDLNRTLIRPS